MALVRQALGDVGHVALVAHWRHSWVEWVRFSAAVSLWGKEGRETGQLQEGECCCTFTQEPGKRETEDVGQESLWAPRAPGQTGWDGP